jgi:hypothetical protein
LAGPEGKLTEASAGLQASLDLSDADIEKLIAEPPTPGSPATSPAPTPSAMTYLQRESCLKTQKME